MHKVLTGNAESWTVLGEDGLPAEPAEAYLAYLAALERSPNTLRAYAHSLRMWLEFLGGQQTGWREAGVDPCRLRDGGMSRERQPRYELAQGLDGFRPGQLVPPGGGLGQRVNAHRRLLPCHRVLRSQGR